MKEQEKKVGGKKHPSKRKGLIRRTRLKRKGTKHQSHRKDSIVDTDPMRIKEDRKEIYRLLDLGIKPEVAVKDVDRRRNRV